MELRKVVPADTANKRRKKERKTNICENQRNPREQKTKKSARIREVRGSKKEETPTDRVQSTCQYGA